MAPLFSINPDGWLLHLHQGLFLFSPPQVLCRLFRGKLWAIQAENSAFPPGRLFKSAVFLAGFSF